MTSSLLSLFTACRTDQGCRLFPWKPDTVWGKKILKIGNTKTKAQTLAGERLWPCGSHVTRRGGFG